MKATQKDGASLLIVNADDANLTAGVNRSILEANQTGIVTSATFMINLPLQPNAVRDFKKVRRTLGLGVHLNVSAGRPVSKKEKVRSLIEEDGRFRKRDSLLKRLPSAAELVREYENQVLLFRKCFGYLPTHLDTHHQLHDHPFYFRAVLHTARRFRLPARRSALLKKKLMPRGVPFSDSLLGDLRPEGYWRKKKLLRTLAGVSAGLHEVMCHPGIVDADLKAVSSFTEGREAEFRLLASPALKKSLAGLGFRLTHYGVCYT